MFENGNYRRRRRMKRPYRTGAHFSKLYADPYGTGAGTFAPRSVFQHNSYQPYPRYDSRYVIILILYLYTMRDLTNIYI